MEISKKEFFKENEYLSCTRKIICKEISSLGKELYDKEEKIQEFQKFMWDSRHDMDPSEMKTMVTTSDLEVEMALRKSKYFQKLYRIQNNPYFGAIVFKDEKEEQKIYIGITHVEDENKYLIHDWRAPICSLFYDYEAGEASYNSPSGIKRES